MKRGAILILLALALPGCMESVADRDLPVPSPSVVFRTVRILAGPGGRLRMVHLPTGWAIAVWTNGERARAIRRYMASLSVRKTLRAKAVLTGKSRKSPLWRRVLSVPDGSPFLVSRWQIGGRTVEVDGFFMILGPHATPVLAVRETGPGWTSCRTLSPGSSGTRKIRIRKGTETLTFSWENPDVQK